jgi:hypothetical protein
MPIALQRYWLAGKGAVKIRWNVPGDFKRCVRALTKYFPTNPEGLCNILHTKATGGPPGHGSLEPKKHGHSADLDHDSGLELSLVAAAQLLASQPQLGKRLWMGPVAPIGVPTAEPRRMRVFEPGAFSHRPLPLPLKWRKADAQAHEGAVTVGRILGLTYGPDHNNSDYAWGWGDWLDEDMVPESKIAQYMVDQGIVGASVDPGGRVVASVNPANGGEYTSQYVIGGVTLVSTAAFEGMQLKNMGDEDWDDDDPDMDPMSITIGTPEAISGNGGCGCGHSATVGEGETYTVNPSGWEGLALAPRDLVFDNDDAVKRIAAWAQVNAEGADLAKLHRAFLWRDPRLPETQTQSYRMPVGDIVNGELTLVFHAIYAAAALISGAHGGLPSVSEDDKNKIRNVISDMYKVMAAEFNDSSLRAPWDRPENEGQQFAMAGKQEPYGDVKYADPGYRDNKKRYPIDTAERVRAAWGYINVADNASEYTPEQLKIIKERIQQAMKKFGIGGPSDETVKADLRPKSEHSLEYNADGAEPETYFPLAPSKTWFEDPQLPEKTALTITAAGQVYGHLAAWNECHRDVTNKACVLAPKSFKEYAPFHLGSVVTAEGDTVKVGKIVQDTRHADIRMGYASAAIHYDDTGDEVAVVRAGEDAFGIWVAGAVVPDATPRKVAKLRRSPISGDWRGVDGHLELTAALAVNVPAFPVYAMDGDEQFALVAAGVVYPEDDIPPAYEMPNFGITGRDDVPIVDMDALAVGVLSKLREMQAQEDRGLRLAELMED